MLLQSSKIEIEQSGSIKESEFGISDTGMVMRHMITTIYSDKIGTVVREIGSNARDAHREFGTPDRPIRIKFPNKFDPTFEVRDWGCGISPDRMQNIFIKLGASTKRGDNTQTGGFGIGAKTPWCYTDSFTIKTTAMENGKLVHREYAAITDEEKYKLMEMGEPKEIDPNDTSIPEEDRHTGTVISLIARDHDWQEFKSKVIYFMRYWNVRPELTGCSPTPEWPVTADYKFQNEADGWKAGNGGSYYGNNSNLLLIDGIPYPLSHHSLTGLDSKTMAVLNVGVMLEFGVGELDLSLNREQVQYTDRTVKAISARLRKVHDALIKVVQDEVENAPSYWDAHIVAIEARDRLSRHMDIPTLTWKGHTLMGKGHFDHKSGIVQFDSYRRRGHGTDYKIKHDTDCWNLPIQETVIVVEKDEDMVSRGKLMSLLDEADNITVYMVIFNQSPDKNVQDALAKWKKENCYDLWKDRVKTLSSIPKPAPKPRAARGQSQVIKAYRLSGGKFRESANNVDLTNGNGIYVEIDRGQAVGEIATHNVYELSRHFTMDVIGIPTRFLPRLGAGWVHVKKAALDKWQAEEKAFKATDVEFYLANVKYILRPNRRDSLLLDANFVDKISASDSTLRKWIDLTKKVHSIAGAYDSSKHRKLEKIGEILGVQVNVKIDVADAENVYKEAHARYPLFVNLICQYDIMSNFEKYAEDLLFYVNAKDAQPIQATASDTVEVEASEVEIPDEDAA